MSRVNITDAGGRARQEIEMWGVVFEHLHVTRSREKEIDILARRLEEIDEGADDARDQLIANLGAQLDVRLAPTEGRRKKASALLMEKYKADEISTMEAFGLIQKLDVASVPT